MANPATNPFALLADDASIVSAAKPKQQTAAASPSLETQKTPAERAAARANKPAPRKKAQQAQVSDDGFEVVPRRHKEHANKGEAVKAAPAKENARRDAANQAPPRGRPKDRESGSKITRKPPPKRGGGGKGNIGKPTPQTEGSVDAVLDEINADVPPQDEVKDVQPAGDAAGETSAEAPAPEPEDKQRVFDDYLRIRQQEAEALKAKVGEIVPRKVDSSDIDKFLSQKAGNESQPSTKGAGDIPSSRKGTKLVDASQFFTIVTPPTGGESRGRGRGRGRGGRGRDRNDGDRTAKSERGNSDAKRGGSRGRGGRGNAGGRGGRGRTLDMKNTKQFPSLG